MDGLKMPDPLSRSCVQRHDAIAEEVVSLTVAAIVILCRRSEGQKNHATFGVNAENRPSVYAAAVLPGITCPGIVTELAWLWNNMKPPHQFAGIDIEGAYVS